MRMTIGNLSRGTAVLAVLLAAAPARAQAVDPSQDQTARPKAIEYSDGYLKRNKIHKYASFATLPELSFNPMMLGWVERVMIVSASRSTPAALAGML